MLFTPFAIPIIAILAVFGYLAILAVAQAVCTARKHRLDAELKITLAERGMSAAEIERVVAASPRRGGLWGCADRGDADSRGGPEFPLGSEGHPSAAPLPPRK